MSVNTKMTAIADEIRTLSGTTDTMNLDTMATNVGNANTEIDSQEDLLTQIATVLEQKSGVAVTVNINKSGKVTTITITDSEGVKTATVNDGEDGIGIASVEQTTSSFIDGGENVITVTKTDDTTSTFTVKNGNKGSQGERGFSVYVATKAPVTNPNGDLEYNFLNDGFAGGDLHAGDILICSSNYNVYKIISIVSATVANVTLVCNIKGADGTIPVKGTDYFTEADKTEIANEVATILATETWTFTLSDGTTVNKVVPLV